MIEAKQIKLGNYITHDQMDFFRIDEIVFIEHLGYCGVMYPSFPELYQKLTMSLSDAKPITLTEEILVKCGFHISKKPLTDEDTDSFKEYCLRKPMDFVTPGLKFYYSPISEEINRVIHLGDYISAEVGYLHQLQNLYFALTGKELEIKL